MSEFILCSCNSLEHQIALCYDDEYNVVYCNIHLVKKSFFKRLWHAIKYVFGYKCKFGAWDEFIIDNHNVNSFKKVLNKIQ